MTTARLLYWASTLLLSCMYLAAAAFYLTHRNEVEAGFVAFGFPAYLVRVLIVAKIAAPLAILSRVSVRLSDLAYAGMFYHLLLALSAHLNAADRGFLPAILALGLLALSFFSQNAARKTISPNVPAWSPRTTSPGRA